VTGGDWTAQPDKATAITTTKPVDDKLAANASLIHCFLLMRERDTILFAFDKSESSVCNTTFRVKNYFLLSEAQHKSPSSC
jgi:hypothetical protein